MQPSSRSALVLLCLILGWGSARGADPAIPAELAVPSDQQRVATLTAKGVQIYECRPVAAETGKYEWAFKAPEAELFDAQGHPAGKHYAGPTWEFATGNKVVGKVKSKVDAPDGKGIPWLLLDVVSQEDGRAMMVKLGSIQRVNTVGGKAPAEAADQSKAGQERRVEYTATYVFYTVGS